MTFYYDCYKSWDYFEMESITSRELIFIVQDFIFVIAWA